MIQRVIVSVMILFSSVSLIQPKIITKCEVCEGVLNKLKSTLPSDATPQEIEAELFHWCDTSATGQESKLCHYMGGTRTSIKRLMPVEFSVPMSQYAPSHRICRERLSMKDPQVCALEYDYTEKRLIDGHTSSLDLRTVRVKDLRTVLAHLGLEDTRKAVEKIELAVKIEQLKDKLPPMPSKEL